MVNIKEGLTNKVPGLTSLYVSFDYKKEIVDTIKSTGNCVYDKKTSTWECPTTSLYKLIKLISYYDSVHLVPYDYSQMQKETELIDFSKFKTSPFEYQKQGIQFGISHDKWLLLDAPGLGKSLQAIYIAEELHNRGLVNKCLIISGKNMLKYNWKNEIGKHSTLDASILGEKTTKTGKNVIGSVKERIASIPNIKTFFTITNIETLRAKEIIKPINDTFDMIIIDECHVTKDPSSEQGANMLKLKAKYKLAMTGTLLLNSPFDCYVPLRFIEAEKCPYSNFRYYYGKYMGYNLVGYNHVDVLKQQLEEHSLRRTKDLLDLPDKNIIDEYLEMNDDQKLFYENIQNGIVDQVDKVHIDTVSLLAMITRLRQATALPDMLSSEKISSIKLERCCELVDEIIQNGDSVVVFSTYKDTVYKLQTLLGKYRPLIATGDTTETDLDVRFQDPNGPNLFIGTWQKSGTGLTLTKANYMIFIDTPYTYAVYEQAQDRIYRIGTNRKVFIYNLICKDTIDERVVDIVNTKRAISDYVIDDKISNEAVESLRKYIVDLSGKLPGLQ